MKASTEQLPDNFRKDWWLSIIYNLVASIIASVFSIYVLGEYGIVLFIVLPFFIGFFPVWLYSFKKKNITHGEAVGLGMSSLAFHVLCLLVFGFEGLICVVMASPLLLIMTWIGAYIAFEIRKAKEKKSAKGNVPLLSVILLFPLFSIVDKYREPDLNKVTTSIIIDASPEEVWKNVVTFPQLSEPDELLFRAGIAYPINAEIKGNGVGAVRYCNFTTGSFVEPITTWDEPKLLAFNVKEQPASMKEMSFWDIDAPHLHDYFVSRKGQFKLIPLPGGKTRLEGTTWYYHDIKPAFYWQLWSEHIVHQIHMRVLKHIKVNAERK